MKSIGRLFSRSKNLRPRKLVPGAGKRRLRSEALERRELLAGDLLAFHNDFAPVDVDHNFRLEPYDALVIINHLNRHGAGSVESMTAEGETGLTAGFMDVDGDNSVAPYDALQVINALNRGQGIDGEVMELRLDVRDHNTDVSLLDAGSRTLNIGLNETTGRTPIVDLEVSYLDLRTFGADAGAFAVFVDLFTPNSGVSFSDIVEPVVTETQELLFSKSIQQASGNLLFSLDPVAGFPSNSTVVSVPVSTLGSNPQTAVEQVLRDFGFEDSEFSVEVLPPLNDTIGLDVQVRFLGDDLANRQLPNIAVDTSQLSGEAVVFQNFETAAINSDGSVNSNAIPLNIDFRSRSAGNQEVYSNTATGRFNASGFDDVGGIGSLTLPSPYNDQGNTVPYDAFSLPVRFKQPIENFVVQIDQPLEDPRVEEGNDLLLIDEGDKLVAQNVLVDVDDDPSISGDDRFGLLVFNVVDSPLVAGTGSLTVNEDLTPTLNNTINLANLVQDLTDPNATITINSASDAANGTVSLSGNVATYTPDPNFFGSDSFTYVASNGTDTATGTVNVTVTSQNDAPVAVADPNITATRGSVRIIQPSELTGNDNAGPANENQTLVINSVTGNAVLNANGTVSYTPPSGTATTDTFTYTVRDTGGLISAAATVTVTINDQPVAPTASNFTLSGTENTTLNFSDANLLANVNGTPVITVDSVDGLTSLVTGLGAGTLTDNGNGTYSYTPVNGDVFGNVATFTYTVSNAQGSDQGTVTINLAAVNDAPTAVDDDFDVEELSGVTTLPVLNNDSAGPREISDSITITAVSAVSAGANVTISADGKSIQFDPQMLNPGQATFSYTIRDSGNSTSQATVTVDVTQGPRPRAVDDVLQIEEGTTGLVPVLANDRANPGETLSIDQLGPITVGAGQATVSIEGNSVRVTPSANYNGNVVFTYSVTDSGGVVTDQAAATGTVTVSVGPVNDPPVIGVDAPRTTTSNVALSVAVSELLSNDNPGVGESEQTLSVSAVTTATAQGGTAVLNGGTILYTPPTNFEGTDTLTYTVSDNGDPVASSTATLTIQVTNINPTAGTDNVVAFVNSPATFTASQLLNNDSAGEANQSLSIVAVNATAGTQGTVTLQANGSVRFVPTAEFIGSTSFQYTISDGIETATGTVNVDVQEFQPSTISGSVFFDSIASISNPVRDGIRQIGEQGLSGIDVTLTSAAADNVTGSLIVRTQATTLTGEFSFGLLAPGTYTVSVDLPSDVIDGKDTAGTMGDLDSVANQFTINIPQPGGANATNYDFSLIGYSGTAAAAAMENAEMLASTYLNHNLGVASSSDGGVQGGTASLNADGTLNFLTIGEGFDGVKHAEIVLNEELDSALLTIIDSANQVLTARLDESQFLVVSDGLGGMAVRFFGGLEDFVFAVTSETAVRQEFEDFRNAIDQILASGEF